MPNINVSILVGSLRQKSLAKNLSRALVKVAPQGLAFSNVELGDLQHYNEDLEADPPAAYKRFRAAIRACDALLFVTPEFNRGMPGMMKNAIDVGSRPWTEMVWPGKPAAIISVSSEPPGGFGANHQLRQCISSVGVCAMPHPEAYIGRANPLFDAEGELTDPATKELVTRFMGSFKSWVDQLRK